MDDNKKSIWNQVDMKVFVPGVICLVLVVALGAIFPVKAETILNNTMTWLMEHFKWFYTLVVCLIVGFCLFIIFSKYGNIRLGGKNAKPSLKTSTWFTLTLTGTIAVGICFYGVSAPVNMFMNPPAFMGVEGGTQDAVIPVLKYCFLHYGIPPFFLIIMLALMIALIYYNGKRTLKASDTLYPLLGKKSQGFLGNVINTLVMVSLLVCGTNMGLAVIQLNAGIGTVAGMSQTPHYEVFITIFYTVLTIILATSGVHKLMGKISNINATGYFLILTFIVLFGPAGGNRLLGTYFTSIGEFIADFIPMITFGDPIYQTGWQNHMTMYYFSWNIAPALLHALFYVSIAYGRTLRQFLIVNCLLPAAVTMFWYVAFGGTAMFSILNGSNLYEIMQKYGDGISTFAFLGAMPGGSILKWLFILLAIMTFLTFSDSIAFSFPMLFMKKTEVDASLTKVPKMFNAVIGLFMGSLTLVLLYIGGYDALSTAMVVLAFPAAILLFMVVLSALKMLFNREKYDLTYIAELEEEKTQSIPKPDPMITLDKKNLVCDEVSPPKHYAAPSQNPASE